MKNKKETKIKNLKKNKIVEYINVDEAAKYLGVSRESIYQYIAKYDNFPWHENKSGKKRFIKSELKCWKRPIADVYRVEQNKDNDLISISNVSGRCKVSIRKIFNLMQTKGFPKPISVENIRYFDRAELSEWIKEHNDLIECDYRTVFKRVYVNSKTEKLVDKVEDKDENMLTISETMKYLDISRGRLNYIIKKNNDFLNNVCSIYRDRLYINKNKLDKWISENNIIANKPKRSDGFIPITDLFKIYSLTPGRLSILISSSTFPNIIKYGSTNYIKEEDAKQWMNDHNIAAKKPRKKARRRVLRKKK